MLRIDGGAEGTRTPYLDSANVALSQMSYGPTLHVRYMPSELTCCKD